MLPALRIVVSHTHKWASPDVQRTMLLTRTSDHIRVRVTQDDSVLWEREYPTITRFVELFLAHMLGRLSGNNTEQRFLFDSIEIGTVSGSGDAFAATSAVPILYPVDYHCHFRQPEYAQPNAFFVDELGMHIGHWLATISCSDEIETKSQSSWVAQ